MEDSFESKYHTLEENYWWCRARRDLLVRLLRKEPRDSRILDIGCAGGLLIKALKDRRFTNINGIDISSKAVRLCKKRNISGISMMDASKMSFPDEAFNIAIALDVLEHLDDDAATLREWNRILAQRGKLIMLVPAFPSLWSKHDEINHHRRRYTRRHLCRLLRAAGFSIERATYWNFMLFFPAALIRIGQRVLPFFKSHKDQAYQINPTLNMALTSLVQAENKVLTNANLPVGLSVFIVARKNPR
jgi:ubiquinone/menaquinone biosynthesis C-methylase UbiE